jgi:hypothetical protein
MAKLSLLTCLIIAAPLAAEEPAKKPTEEGLRKELLQRVKEDQDARKVMIEWMRANKPEPGKPVPPEMEKVGKIDEANTKWLRNVVDKHGWPTVTMVGKDGAQAAWLLVQHADKDRKFQRQCLDLMKDLLAKGEADKKNFAYLTDRVLLAEGKKQLYGTQFHQVNGRWEPRPLEDPLGVDDRRKEMGLGTLEEYRKVIEQQYGPKKK